MTGTVAETMNSGGYTYVRLRSGNEDAWFAASQFAVKVGDRLTMSLDMPVRNYHSRTLNRDFPVVYFVAQVARDGETLTTEAQGAAPPMSPAHQTAGKAPPGVERIAPAAGGMSIADVWVKRASLAGTRVIVRGKVVKVNNGILDRNWIHLQDGSGSVQDNTNDLTVTTDAVVAVGDIVTATGVVAIDKDFGSGYSYVVMLEKATVTADMRAAPLPAAAR